MSLDRRLSSNNFQQRQAGASMPMQNLRPLQAKQLAGDVVSLELSRLEAARQTAHEQIADVSAELAQMERDQLAREIADIESATAALRQAEPALFFGNETMPEVAVRKPRPIWRLIAVLWIVTGLVTAGALVAVATLVG
jgi:hypothetical protein